MNLADTADVVFRYVPTPYSYRFPLPDDDLHPVALPIILPHDLEKFVLPLLGLMRIMAKQLSCVVYGDRIYAAI